MLHFQILTLILPQSMFVESLDTVIGLVTEILCLRLYSLLLESKSLTCRKIKKAISQSAVIYTIAKERVACKRVGLDEIFADALPHRP